MLRFFFKNRNCLRMFGCFRCVGFKLRGFKNSNSEYKLNSKTGQLLLLISLTNFVIKRHQIHDYP